MKTNGTESMATAVVCTITTAVAAALAIPWAAHASVSYSFDKAAWEAAAGGAANITQINFANVPAWTLVSNQWAAKGVTFTDGDDWTADVYMGSYPQYKKRAIVGKDV